MQVLHDEFKDVPGVDVVALHMEGRGGDPEAYHAEHGYSYTMFAEGGAAFAEAHGIRGLPTFVVFGPDGNEITRHVGMLNDDARETLAKAARDAS